MTRLPLTHAPRSVPDVVEVLELEFGGGFPRGAVAAVVGRLSANDAVSVPVLEHLARNALRALLAAEPERLCEPRDASGSLSP